MSFKVSKKYLVIFLVLILGLVFLNLFPKPAKALENFIFKVFSPVQKIFIRTGNKISDFFQILISIKDLNKENAELKQKNSDLEAQLTQLKEIEKENETLRTALNFAPKNTSLYEIASVVGKNIQGTEEWILIDKGTDDGVEKNMAIISEEFFLVGKVIEPNKDFSKVMLITDKNSLVAALIENRRNEGLVQKEEGSDKIFLDFIPKTEKVEIGEKILTSGMDNIFPRGILIGKAESVDSSENQLFQKITISPAVDFNKLEQVFILKNK